MPEPTLRAPSPWETRQVGLGPRVPALRLPQGPSERSWRPRLRGLRDLVGVFEDGVGNSMRSLQAGLSRVQARAGARGPRDASVRERGGFLLPNLSTRPS